MSTKASHITSLTIGLLNRLFSRRSKKISKLRATGLFVGSSPVTPEFLAQKTSNEENSSIWRRDHGLELHRLVDSWRETI